MPGRETLAGLAAVSVDMKYERTWTEEELRAARFPGGPDNYYAMIEHAQKQRGRRMLRARAHAVVLGPPDLWLNR